MKHGGGGNPKLLMCFSSAETKILEMDGAKIQSDLEVKLVTGWKRPETGTEPSSRSVTLNIQ